jgi:hypothetical protein
MITVRSGNGYNCAVIRCWLHMHVHMGMHIHMHMHMDVLMYTVGDRCVGRSEQLLMHAQRRLSGAP